MGSAGTTVVGLNRLWINGGWKLGAVSGTARVGLTRPFLDQSPCSNLIPQVFLGVIVSFN